ncbi:alcohol dehydrogenase [Phenylobacterium sp. Root77]|uniref:aldo/keto reductase n=1 Tax=unclassified Phenylobacterium TaxID=2640670 RepID=UPI0006FD010F|nr:MULTISPECIES: aldo/keto reductase [unclassified Phenylobacterium]KQW70316.1 alcohol dehydrogenase [Phenylobacterium sp. Root1277]KQW91263.1 alcohol dehydrogenase [Phenylobacterium sp. Root1290]KRC39100.1 alcohol dehydrogenase [Phenylobacterium sp. Root77]
MELRRLGKSDLKVAPLVLGGNVFGWTADEATSFKLLDAFVAGGFNMIDTADVYSRWAPAGGGASETVIGKWLAQGGKRDKIVLATKLGSEMGEGMKGLSAKYMVEAVEASLKRLQTDYIDLYQSHRDDPETPQEETAEAFDRLVKSGKVRAIGSSNFTPERLKSALEISEAKGLPRYNSEQPLYNLYARQGFESGLQQVCIDEQVGVIPYYGLASGFLTGKYRTEADLSKSPRGQGVKRMMDARGMRILAALDEVSAARTASQAQVALAWVMAQPGLTGPIASATSLEQLDELMGSARLTLTSEDLATLDKASADS